MDALDALGVGYVMGGRLYDKTRHAASVQPACPLPRQGKSRWQRLRKEHCVWRFVEMRLYNEHWRKARRAIYSRTEARSGQYELPLDEVTESIIYTNIESEGALAEQLAAAGRADLVEAGGLLRLYHGRGSDELVHRHLKEFAPEQLPFKRFAANQAYYYLMLLAFFVYECYKEDVCAGVIALTAYPTTFRRTLLDVAGKLVRGKNRLVLKVTTAVWQALDFQVLWKRANAPQTWAL